jgi:hypothetical protein
LRLTDGPTKPVADYQSHYQTRRRTRLPSGDYVVELAVGAFGQSPKSDNTLIFLSTTLTVRA